jgi:hypothetical protein
MVHGDPHGAGWTYLMPDIRAADGMGTDVHIYNDGEETVTVDLTWLSIGDPAFFDVEIPPHGNAVVSAPAGFEGALRADSSQPLAIVVDLLDSEGDAGGTYNAVRNDLPELQEQSVPWVFEEEWATEVAVVADSATSVTVEFRDAAGIVFESFEGEVGPAGERFVLPAVAASFGPGSVHVHSDSAVVATVSLEAEGLVSRTLNLFTADAALRAPDDGVTLTALPVAGRDGDDFGSLLVHNANEAEGATTIGIWVFDGMELVTVRCASVPAGGVLRWTLNRQSIADGFEGSLVVGALASNQEGGPALTTVMLNPVETDQPLQIELFEGWNFIPGWQAESVSGVDLVIDALDGSVAPIVWTTVAHYDPVTDEWLQTFRQAPLPSFNTLTGLQQGQDYWIFVTGDALLTFAD